MSSISKVIFICLMIIISFQCQQISSKSNDSEEIDIIKISNEKINDLKILGQIWGFLKYYHPNVAKGAYNWDNELLRVLPLIDNVKSKNERDKLLTDWIKELGTFDIDPEINMNEKNVKIRPDFDWITNSHLSQELVHQLLNVKNAKRKGNHYYVNLGMNAQNPQFENEKAYNSMKIPNIEYRLLSLFRYWNIIQYFFPYKYLIDEDWKSILEKFIPKFISSSDELKYKCTVLELIGYVHDTHANIWGRDSCLDEFKGYNFVPVKITFIEEQAVVTDYFDKKNETKSGLLVGDVILKVNNQAVGEIVQNKLKYTPASNYVTQLRDIAFNLLRTNDSILELEYIRNNKSHFIKLKTYSIDTIHEEMKLQNKDTCFKIIEPGIAYLYLGSIKTSYLQQIMDNIKNTKGLIIDLRCYPSEFVVFSLGEYLVPESKPFVKFTIGSIQTPGLFSYTDNLTIGNNGNIEKYKGKIIILINESTQSQAEYTTMAFRVAPNAKVIGSQTAGADGNVSQFYLPGGIRTMISGIGVYYPDGKETQRIGIVPDIEVKPTIEGIKQGKDEVLEKAIHLINNN